MSKYLLDSHGKKVIYDIKTATSTLIEDSLASLGMENKVDFIKSGRAGITLLVELDSKYSHATGWEVGFDPIESNPEVNPLVNGWRLSSYAIHIISNGELIKLIPRNPHHNYGA